MTAPLTQVPDAADWRDAIKRESEAVVAAARARAARRQAAWARLLVLDRNAAEPAIGTIARDTDADGRAVPTSVSVSAESVGGMLAAFHAYCQQDCPDTEVYVKFGMTHGRGSLVRRHGHLASVLIPLLVGEHEDRRLREPTDPPYFATEDYSEAYIPRCVAFVDEQAILSAAHHAAAASAAAVEGFDLRRAPGHTEEFRFRGPRAAVR